MQSKISHLTRPVILKHKRLQSVSYLLNANDLISLVEVKQAHFFLFDIDLDTLIALLVQCPRNFSLVINSALADVAVYDKVAVGNEDESLQVVDHFIWTPLNYPILQQLTDTFCFVTRCYLFLLKRVNFLVLLCESWMSYVADKLGPFFVRFENILTLLMFFFNLNVIQDFVVEIFLWHYESLLINVEVRVDPIFGHVPFWQGNLEQERLPFLEEAHDVDILGVFVLLKDELFLGDIPVRNWLVQGALEDQFALVRPDLQ